MGYPFVGARGGYVSGNDIGFSRNMGPQIAGDTGSLTVVSGTCYAQYIGQVPRALSSILAMFYGHGANAVAGAGGASVNWGEIGIAKGTLGAMSTAPVLTVLGYTSISAALTTAATTWQSASVSASIPANTDLWIVIAAAYETTQASFRIPVNWVNGRGYAATKAATQPSAVLGTAQTFGSTVTTGTVVPFMNAQWG
jgi:hypothetical protein